jgi:small-conductance mechanosensitive channel
MLTAFLNQPFLNNRVLDFAVSAAILAGLSLAIKVLDLIVLARLQRLAAKTDNTLDNRLIEAADRKGVPLLYLGAVYLSIRHLALTPLTQRIVNVSAAAILTLLAAKLVLALAAHALEAHQRRQGGAASPQNAAYRGILTVLQMTVWGLAALILLDNFGVKVSALVAGLGIGGLAVAFAAQKILGDLFSYFSIFFDRPFEIGDFVTVGEFSGTVEHIGIKSTRIRSLSGEQLVFANTDLTNSRLRNYQRMTRRRVSFRVGVTYDTDVRTAREIPGMVAAIVAAIPGATFERAHLAALGEYSLAYEVVYHVESDEYARYMDIQQQINLAVMEAFAKKGIRFAYPTQTVHVGTGSTPEH